MGKINRKSLKREMRRSLWQRILRLKTRLLGQRLPYAATSNDVVGDLMF